MPEAAASFSTRWSLLCVALATLAALPASALASPPPNDDFANAQDLGSVFPASASGTNVDATVEPGEPAHHGAPARASVWYRWTAPASGRVRIDTCQSDFPTVLAVYTGSRVDALQRVEVDHYYWGPACRDGVAHRLTVAAGTTYRIAVDSRDQERGAVELRVGPTSPPPNDDFASAEDLGNEGTVSVSGSTVDATAEPREPLHADIGARASVWYRWTAPSSRTFEVNTCASGFDTVLAVYRGAALGALRGVVASNDGGCGVNGLASRVRFKATAGTTYRIAVDGDYDEGPVELALRPAIRVWFEFRKFRRNARRGTGTIVVRVPGPGRLRLDSRTSRLAKAEPQAAGKVRLPVRAFGKAKTRLKRRGKAKVRVDVSYVPADTNYFYAERTKYVTLIKRR